MAQFAPALIIGAISLAANLGLALLQPDNKIDGSRLNDLKAPKSNYGVQIPKVYGRGRVTGNLIWADEIKEVPKKKKSGKGFGGSTTQKTYSYYGNFSVLLSERIVGVRKLWLNSKLVYNSTGDSETVDNSVAWADKYIRIYTGDPSQGLDPLEQSVLGAKAIAYRHRARIVFEMLPLEEFGNRFPQVSAELQGTADNPLLSDIVKDICKSRGLTDSQIDVTELADITVSGYTIFQTDTARQALGNLQQAYFFDCVEVGNKLRFQKITRPYVAATITKNDLASYEFGQSRPGDNFKEILTQPLELPTSVNVTFFDANSNHAEAVVRSSKVRTQNTNDENVTFALALAGDEAKRIADRLLYLSWLRRRKFSFTLPPRFGYLEPGDVVATPFHEQIEKVQITKINHGANRLIECEAFLYDAAVISTTQSLPPDDPPDDPVSAPSQTTLKILDIPLIDDDDYDNGLYVSSSQPSSLFVSRNGGSSYDYVTDHDLPSTYGSCNSTLGNWSNDSLIDISNTIGVTLSQGELESISLTDLNNGANTALIGNEIVRFQTATLTGTNTYTLSNLLRGRRGTENYIATHASGETFTLLSDYVTRVNGNVTDIGKTLYFKAITGDQSLDEVTAVTLTVVGNSLKPYSPVNLAASKDAAGNISLAWTRRDRKAGDRTDYANFPLSEVSEKYEIEILNGSTVVRTLPSASPNIIYSSSLQLTDFGSLQSSITFRVYQISAVFGRGTGRTATITLSLISSVPKITGFSPTQGAIGTTVTVYGSGFVGATALAINGTACTSLSIISDTQITGTIASGTTSGFVTVTTPGGTATSGTAFVIVAAASASNFLALTDTPDSYLGQALKTIRVNGAATALEFVNPSGRELLTAARTYYVATTGSDSNDGLTSGTAFATLQKAIDTAANLDLGNFDVTIQLADGTYTVSSTTSLKTIIGAGKVIIQGNASTPSNVVIDYTASGECLRAYNVGGQYYLKDFKINASSGISLLVFGSSVDFDNLIFGAANFHMIAMAGAKIFAQGNYTIAGGCLRHCWAQTSSLIHIAYRTLTITGTPNWGAEFAYAERGHIEAHTMLLFGSATGRRYYVARNGTIFVNTSSTSYLPGNSSGIVESGGQYG